MIQAYSVHKPISNLTPRPLESRQATSAGIVDTVQFQTVQQAHFEPAAHVERSTNEYLALVATHPSDREEYLEGVQAIKEVVAEILYGGRWPEAEELPRLPNHKSPGNPKQNGGLTRSEQLVSDDLIALYRKTAPSVQDPQQHKRLASAIHVCQSGLQGRVLRRDYPDYWMSSPGTLKQDAQREESRWGPLPKG